MRRRGWLAVVVLASFAFAAPAAHAITWRSDADLPVASGASW